MGSRLDAAQLPVSDDLGVSTYLRIKFERPGLLHDPLQHAKCAGLTIALQRFARLWYRNPVFGPRRTVDRARHLTKRGEKVSCFTTLYVIGWIVPLIEKYLVHISGLVIGHLMLLNCTNHCETQSRRNAQRSNRRLLYGSLEFTQEMANFQPCILEDAVPLPISKR